MEIKKGDNIIFEGGRHTVTDVTGTAVEFGPDDAGGHSHGTDLQHLTQLADGLFAVAGRMERGATQLGVVIQNHTGEE